jgi:phosphatidylglycerophosphate synthase
VTQTEEPGGRSWVTAANALSLARLAAAPLLVAALLAGRHPLSLVIFTLAVITDLADGRVARRRGQVSALGGVLDHGSDALFASAGLGALACRGEVPALLPVFVILAFLQYLIDSRGIAGRPLRGSRLGRYNGIAYFVLLGTPIVRDALSLSQPGASLVCALGWALLASTLASMVSRAWAQRRTGV